MRSTLSRRQIGVLLAAVTALISGFAVFFNGYGVRAWSEVADPTTYTTLKNLIAALVVGVAAGFVASRRRPISASQPLGRTEKALLLLIPVVGGSVPFVLFFEGFSQASAPQAAFIHKTLFIWVAIMATVFLKERLSWPHVAALGLLVWGQLTLVGDLSALTLGQGEVMILMATFLWAVEVIIAKRVLAAVRPTTVSAVRMIGGSLILVAYVLVRGISVNWSLITVDHAVWILVAGVVLSGYVLSWHAALHRAPAVDVTAVLVAGAVITALLQTAVRGVPMPDVAGLVLLSTGAALVVVASFLGARRGSRREGGV